jgi:hypothetical protein
MDQGKFNLEMIANAVATRVLIQSVIVEIGNRSGTPEAANATLERTRALAVDWLKHEEVDVDGQDITAEVRLRAEVYINHLFDTITPAEPRP